MTFRYAPRVEGYLENMDFQKGREVTKGSMLYTIDPRTFEAKMVEAQGHMAEAHTMMVKAKSDTTGRARIFNRPERHTAMVNHPVRHTGSLRRNPVVSC